MIENKTRIEFAVGLFLLAGIAAVSYIALRLGDIGMLDRDHYVVVARFTSASGLRPGAFVEAGGVRVGRVQSVEFEPEHYLAVVTLSIDRGVPIAEDAIASIQTAGIIGEKFVKISPGGSEELLGPGMEIYETLPSINLEELISKYIFEGGAGN